MNEYTEQEAVPVPDSLLRQAIDELGGTAKSRIAAKLADCLSDHYGGGGMVVTVIGPNLRDQSKGEFHVHAAGCADIERDPKRYGYRLVGPHMKLDAASRVAVAGAVYEDIIDEQSHLGDPYQIAKEYLDSFHFAPCCDDLREEA